MNRTNRYLFRQFLSKSCVFGGAALTAVCAHAGQTATEFSYQSELGDIVGGGRAESFSESNATIDVATHRVEHTAIVGMYSGATITVTTPSGKWSVVLNAPRGETLRPGRFFGADELTSGHSPGLRVAFNDTFCGQVWGNFVVDQIATDSTGNVTMLDATFKQRCDSPDAPALTGTVKYHAPPLSFSVVSSGDDPIGRGVTTRYTGSNAVFDVEGTAESARLRVFGKREYWTIILLPPSGKKLRPGSYPVTYGDPNVTNLMLGHDNAVVGFGNGWGHTCPYDPDKPGTGDLTINTIRFDDAGNVVGLNAFYTFQCGGHTGSVRGKINYYQ